MKQVIAFAVCMFMCGTILAQYPVEHKKKHHTAKKAVAMKNQPAAHADNKKPVAMQHIKADAAKKIVASKKMKTDAAAPKKVVATEHKKSVREATAATHRTAIGGFIHDARMHPIQGVQAFIYMPDSTIGASGYTDAMGYYETNSVGGGKYDLKIVYPNSKAVTVKGVPVKNGVTKLSLYTNPPEADTMLLYADMYPKVEAKKKAK